MNLISHQWHSSLALYYYIVSFLLAVAVPVQAVDVYVTFTESGTNRAWQNKDNWVLTGTSTPIPEAANALQYPTSVGFNVTDEYIVEIPDGLSVNVASAGSGFGAGILIKELHIGENSTVSVSSAPFTSLLQVTGYTQNNGTISVTSSQDRFAEAALGTDLGSGTYLIFGTSNAQAVVRATTLGTLTAKIFLEGGNARVDDYDGNSLLTSMASIGAGGRLSLNAGATLNHQGHLANHGILSVNSVGFSLQGGSSIVQNGNLENDGFIDVNTAFDRIPGQLAITGNFSQTGGSTNIVGKLSVSASFTQTGGWTNVYGELIANRVDNLGGIVMGAGKITGPFINSGDLQPSFVLGGEDGMQVDGSLTLTGDSNLWIDWSSIVAQRYWSTIETTGRMTLGGDLIVRAPTFAVTSADSFVVATASEMSGAFSNVSSRDRLMTADGSGSFVVTYEAGVGGQVTLSGYQATPEPASATLIVFSGCTLLLRCRPRHLRRT